MISTTTGEFCFPSILLFSQCWPMYIWLHCGISGPNQILGVCGTLASLDIIGDMLWDD
jgi:hypothetical protein